MLLRMLEPAVRPTGLPTGGAVKPSAQPFESRSFESLLQDAQRPPVQATAQQDAATAPASPTDMPRQDASALSPVAEATSRTQVLGPLSGLGTIENATLRQLMAQHAAAQASNGA